MDSEEILSLSAKSPVIIKTNNAIIKKKISETRFHKIHKPVLHAVDSIISIFIVAPLVIGCWRGFWLILDCYSDHFPSYGSFISASIFHVIFLLIRGFIKEHVKKNRRMVKKKLRFICLRRLHAYLYALVCIVQWRGGWLCLDELLGIQVESDGRASVRNSIIIIAPTSAMLLICLVLLKSLRNVVAPPFVIILDNTSAPFNIPTRFRIEVSRVPEFFINTGKSNISATVDYEHEGIYWQSMEPRAEKLVSTNILNDQLERQKGVPQAFRNDVKGPTPMSFMTTTEAASLSRSINPNYPRNIQEIINFIENEHIHKRPSQRSKVTFPKGYPQPTSVSSLNSNSFVSNWRTYGDPFYSYKPENPSDINLMAISNVRFAPPMWANFKSRQSKNKDVSEININSGEIRPSRLKLSLNLYSTNSSPVSPNYPEIENYHSQSFDGQTEKFKFGPRSMVVHLNVYPNKRKTLHNQNSHYSSDIISTNRE